MSNNLSDSELVKFNDKNVKMLELTIEDFSNHKKRKRIYEPASEDDLEYSEGISDELSSSSDDVYFPSNDNFGTVAITSRTNVYHERLRKFIDEYYAEPPKGLHFQKPPSPWQRFASTVSSAKPLNSRRITQQSDFTRDGGNRFIE